MTSCSPVIFLHIALEKFRFCIFDGTFIFTTVCFWYLYYSIFNVCCVVKCGHCIFLAFSFVIVADQCFIFVHLHLGVPLAGTITIDSGNIFKTIHGHMLVEDIRIDDMVGSRKRESRKREFWGSRKREFWVKSAASREGHNVEKNLDINSR